MNAIFENLDKINQLINETENMIADYIVKEYSGRIDFDDYTGYPKFSDDSDSMLQNVVSVKVNDCNEILFNTDMKKDENGKWVVDEDCWFRPRDYGEFDLNNLVDMIFGLENCSLAR